MPELTPEQLKKELKIAMKRGRNYIFSPGKPLEKSVLFLSKKAIPPGERNKAKKKSGSPKVYWGVCRPDGQVLVFEVLKDVPAKLNLDLLRYIKKVAGLKSIDVLFRVNPNMTEIDEAVDSPSGELPVPPATCAKVARTWLDTRTALGKRLDGVKTAILNEYKKHPQLSRVKSAAGRLDEVLEKLGDGAARKLAAAAKAAAEDEQMTLVTEALGDFSAYQGYVNADPIVAALSDSPFGKVPVKETVSKVIAAVTPLLAPTSSPSPAPAG